VRHPLAFLLSLSLVACVFLPSAAHATEPFLKSGDVIALVGGEDMVVAGEDGYFESLLTRALPGYHLRFRNLAWEGDTVFEQRLDLNFPTWEEQLDKVGATVVIVQFGQMESLAGQEKLPEFLSAYGKLIDRFSNGGKRRVVLLGPCNFSPSPAFAPEDTHKLEKATSLKFRNAVLRHYQNAIEDLAKQHGARFADLAELPTKDVPLQRDGIHLTAAGQQIVATRVLGDLDLPSSAEAKTPDALRQLIVAKNRLWFDYWRPQNWAFLAGDRINQPSSRDHIDPSKRWFPPEREQFLPLVEAKEKEIDALAAKLTKP